MNLRPFACASVCAVLVPLIGSTGNWTQPMTASLVAAVQAPDPQSLPVRGSRVERRSAAAGLNPAIEAVRKATPGPAWIAWSVPALDRDDDDAGDRAFGPQTCVLEDDGDVRQSGRGYSGDTGELVMFLRHERNRPDRFSFTDGRCTVEAGSKAVYWLDQVAPPQSVAFLAQTIRSVAGGEGGEDKPSRGPARSALPALAMHADASAGDALTWFVAADQPKWLRRDAAFWLGAARGEAGARVIERLVREDADPHFREHLTFVLTLTPDNGVDDLIAVARKDQAAGVRRQALFWLAQKAGERAVETLSDAMENDPDSEVRKHAVFALSQLPKNEGVPRLIEVARTHRDPEVRKQAMFWLGQSGDERALRFFEEILTK